MSAIINTAAQRVNASVAGLTGTLPGAPTEHVGQPTPLQAIGVGEQWGGLAHLFTDPVALPVINPHPTPLPAAPPTGPHGGARRVTLRPLVQSLEPTLGKVRVWLGMRG